MFKTRIPEEYRGSRSDLGLFVHEFLGERGYDTEGLDLVECLDNTVEYGYACLWDNLVIVVDGDTLYVYERIKDVGADR